MGESILFDEKEMDLDSIVLRRADGDDKPRILPMVENTHMQEFMDIYENTDILHMIETSLVSISAVDQNGIIIAFAAFSDHPQVGVVLRERESRES